MLVKFVSLKYSIAVATGHQNDNTNSKKHSCLKEQVVGRQGKYAYEAKYIESQTTHPIAKHDISDVLGRQYTSKTKYLSLGNSIETTKDYQNSEAANEFAQITFDIMRNKRQSNQSSGCHPKCILYFHSVRKFVPPDANPQLHRSI